MRNFILSTALIMTSACTNSFDNNMNEMALICGEGYDPQKSYILVTDAAQTEKLGLVSLPKDLTPLTAKGCIERPTSGEVFVTNVERTEGVWVNASSKDKVQLVPLATRKLPTACNSVVHGDGRGFTLKFELEEIDRMHEMQNIKVQLKSLTTGELINAWSPRRVEKTTTFDFDENQPMLAGEYLLLAEIKDELSGTLSVSECSLRVDYSELLISPAESIKTRRMYNGQEVLLVQPGYNVNFYVHEGFRDVGIDYCMKRIDTADVRPDIAEEHLRCETTQDFLSTKSQSLDEGFWVLNYRGQRGLVQNAWQHAIFLVDKVCTGSFTSIRELEGRACTTIKGSLTISDLTDENIVTLDSIGVVFGNIDLNHNRAQLSNVFANLSQVFGSVTISTNMTTNLNGFKALNQIIGDLTIAYNNLAIEMKGFENLEMISGNLNFTHHPYLELMEGFQNLKMVEKGIEIENVNIKTLEFLPNLELIGILTLRDLPLTHLSGLKSLRTLGQLDLQKLGNIKDFKGFATIGSMMGLNIIEMENLQSIIDLSVLSIRDITIADCPNLIFGTTPKSPITVVSSLNITRIRMIEDFSSLIFSNEFRYFSLYSTQLQSLKGLEEIVELDFLNLIDVHGHIDLRSFERLKKLIKIEITETSVTRVGELPSLVEVREILISKNSNLTSLPEFAKGISVGKLGIFENPKLEGLKPLLNIASLAIGAEIHSSACLDSSVTNHLKDVILSEHDFESNPIDSRFDFRQGPECPAL